MNYISYPKENRDVLHNVIYHLGCKMQNQIAPIKINKYFSNNYYISDYAEEYGVYEYRKLRMKMEYRNINFHYVNKKNNENKNLLILCW